jgi:hypothetical protein
MVIINAINEYSEMLGNIAGVIVGLVDADGLDEAVG